LVRRWVRRWSITIRWDDARHSPWQTTRYQTYAETPAQLRRLVEAARGDPHVTALPYHSVRILVGDEPTHCPAGHAYRGRVAGRLDQQWVGCQGCGGHHVLVCVAPGCAYPRLADPPIDEGCDLQLRALCHPDG
jgi:hypothetical protein